MELKYLNENSRFIFNKYKTGVGSYKFILTVFFVFFIIQYSILFFTDLNIPIEKKNKLIMLFLIGELTYLFLFYLITQFLSKKNNIIALMYLHSTIFGMGCMSIVLLFFPAYVLSYFLYPELYLNLILILSFLLFTAIIHVIRINEKKLITDSLSIFSGKKSSKEIVSLDNLAKSKILKYALYIILTIFIISMFQSTRSRHAENGLYYVLQTAIIGNCAILYSDMCYVLLIIKIETKKLIKICKRDNKNPKIK